MASLNSGSKVQEPFLGFFEKRRQLVHFKVEDFRAVDIVAHSIRVSFERATEMEESGVEDAFQNWDTCFYLIMWKVKI